MSFFRQCSFKNYLSVDVIKRGSLQVIMAFRDWATHVLQW